MSACNASRLRAVSLSVSPLVRLEVVAEILITSALRRNAASSNDVRVRVLGSTKKFTSVLPRSAGTFLISRVPTCLNASVVSRTKLISSADKSRRPKRSLRVQRVVTAFSLGHRRLACSSPELAANITDGFRCARCLHQIHGLSSWLSLQPHCVWLVVSFLQAHLN